MRIGSKASSVLPKIFFRGHAFVHHAFPCWRPMLRLKEVMVGHLDYSAGST